MPLVITSCTNRKSRSAAAKLCAANLRRGSIDAVASQWAGRVRSAPECEAADSLYQGRSFREAQKAARAAGGRFAVVSAGLGLVPAEARIPAYSLTVVSGAVDNVLEKIVPASSPAAWWRALRQAGLGRDLADLAAEEPVWIAAGRGYLEMLADEIKALPADKRRRVRVFTATPPHELPPVFRPLIVPYDERLDGEDSPRPGALSDFAQRALHDFVSEVLPQSGDADADAHAQLVAERLAPWRRPERTRGAFRTDPEIRIAIAQNWQAVGGRSTAMLRLLRHDLGIACEQGRFRRLFHAVGEEREA
jgi:hypothetical protein